MEALTSSPPATLLEGDYNQEDTSHVYGDGHGNYSEEEGRLQYL